MMLRPGSRRAHWAGWILNAPAVALLLFSGGVKVIGHPSAKESFAELGYPESVGFGIGVLELACTLVFLWPPVAPLGAILLTGYLGGAVATHLRLLHPWLSHTSFPVVVGFLLWAGLALRDRRVRALLGRS